MALALAALTALAVCGIFAGIRMYRAEAKLPGDLMLALEVGSTRTGAVDSLIDRMGMRYAPAVLRLMGPKQVARYRRKIDRVRVFALGVKPQFQHTGTAAAFYVDVWETVLANGVKRAETG